MGCTFGKVEGNNKNRRHTSYQRRNTLVIAPTIDIHQGEGVKIEDPHGTKVIFVFGGPGSGKGTIVNNLVDMFGFKFICGEDLIMENLIKDYSEQLELDKNASNVNTTNAVQKFLAEDSSMLTLKWVLELIDKELEKCANEIVIVDIVPNMKFLLKAPGMSEGCQRYMREFEAKHPVYFAVNLTLEQQQLLANINMTHACTKAPKADGAEKGSSDEIDTSRTQRRFNIYLNSVQHFLDYFNETQRLTIIDTSCGKIRYVWEALRDYIVENSIAEPWQGLDQVILFGFEEEEHGEIDRQRYPMLDINCQGFIPDAQNASPEEILSKLIKKMTDSSCLHKTFCVDVSGTKLTQLDALEEVKSSECTFFEVDIGMLDSFMHGLKRKSQRKKSMARKTTQMLKVVSTGNNDALLFPLDTNDELIRRIGLIFNKLKVASVSNRT